MTDELNPYSPPESEALPEPGALATDVRWFSPRQVGVCTFFGGPLTGTILLWMNMREARSSRRVEVFGGLAATVAILGVGAALPSRSSTALAIVSAIVLHTLTKLQWAERPQQQPRPKLRGGWIQLGVLLGGLALTIVIGALVVTTIETVAPGTFPD